MILFFITLFGLVFGSFVAAYSYRYPRGIKISKGNSFCDNCNRKINWFENIPVISYIFLGGKCNTCNKKISLRYPVIEIISALSFVLLFKYNSSVLDFNYLLLITFYLLLSLIFIIDFEHQLIPDDFVFFGILLTVLSLFIMNSSIVFSTLFAGFLGSSFLALIYLATKGRGMGLGDVKFAIWGGMLVGINNLFIWMLLAFLTGAMVGIILILIGNAKLKDKIAFGPFLVMAVPMSIVWGQKILILMGF